MLRWLLSLEQLEDRTLLSGATLDAALQKPVTFTAFNTAQEAGRLTTPQAVDLYAVSLQAGDQINAAVSAQTSGSGLQSLLRVFDATGHPVALDDQEGGDPHLTFQAPTAGDYFVGVSSAPNDNYDPTVAGSGTFGGTTGLYTLNLRLTPGATPRADLAGSSFRLDTTTAAYGDTVSGSFTIENRGGSASTGFTVQLVLSSGTRLDGFDPSQTLPATFVSGPPALLAAGHAYTDHFTVQLPSTAPANFPASSGPVYLGLLITPIDPTTDSGQFDRSGMHRGVDFETLTMLTPVPAGVTDLSVADSGLNTRTDGTLLTPTQADTYSVPISTQGNGRLTAQVRVPAGTLVPRLTLAWPGGLLIQSDNGVIAQNLQPGTVYSLTVSGQSGTGSYQLTTQFLPASPPFDPLTVGQHPGFVAVADLNGDGQPDLIGDNSDYGNLGILLGNGDGSFQSQQTVSVGGSPAGVAVADVNGDGIPDLITANFNQLTGLPYGTVSVLLGNGDGTFGSPQTFAVGSDPRALAVADVNGDGQLDLITANGVGNNVSVLLNDTAPGSTTASFTPQQTFAAGSTARAVAVADVNGDGRPDLVVANYAVSADGTSSTVSVLLNATAPGAMLPDFAPQETVAVGPAPRAVAAADVNGDGRPDLVTINGNDTVSVLLNDTPSAAALVHFAAQQTFAVGPNPQAVAVADVNGDGRLDLLTANSLNGTDSVLLNETATGATAANFAPRQDVVTGQSPRGLAVADVNGDGIPDLVTANYAASVTVYTGTIRVLLGNGDGSFQTQQPTTAGTIPSAVAVVDLNGDNRADIVTANAGSFTSAGNVSVLLGKGDGTLEAQQTFPIASTTGAVSFEDLPSPRGVAAADLNGDGRPDLVTADYNGKMSVLLGDGDGSFQPPQTFATESGSRAVAVADLNGDGIPDIVTANHDTLSVLLGRGDGTFLLQQTFAVAGYPNAVAVADINGDGKPDLVTANANGTASVLLNEMPKGALVPQFAPEQTFTVGSSPSGVAVADINGDGRPDLAVVNSFDNTVSLLVNETPRGSMAATFAPQQLVTTGSSPQAVALADVNGDGKPDLVVANGYGAVSVFLNKTTPGATSADFPTQLGGFPVDSSPAAVAVADVNGDGIPDIVTANGVGTVSVLLGDGEGEFVPASNLGEGVSLPNTPRLANLVGHTDGTLDSVILDHGDILFRRGVPGTSNQFAAPVTINDTVVNPLTKTPEEVTTRDLTIVHTTSGWAIATADTIPDPNALATTHQFMYSVSLYTYGSNGRFQRRTAFTTSMLPTRIVADDLGDLIVANAFSHSLQVAVPQSDGSYTVLTLPTGEVPSDIALADVNGDGLPDIVVSDQASDDVSVFLNDANRSFTTSYRFRAGTSLYGTETIPGLPVGIVPPAVKSLGAAVSVVGGNFTGDGRQDLVVVNRGAHSFSVLANDGNGGFLAPQAAQTTSTSDGFDVNDQAGPVVAGDFHRSDGLDAHRAGQDDLAILMEDRGEVWIYTNQGNGTFLHTSSYAVGDQPTGLSLVTDPATGLLDLLVGDQFGDIVRLQGKGDGTFEPPVLTGAPLNVTFFPGLATPDALVADQEHNVVTVQAPVAAGSTQFAVQPLDVTSARPNSTLAPGAVQWMPLEDPKGQPDPIVSASGSNQVLVYHTQSVDPATGIPTFSPLTSSDVYNVGDDPVSVTFADLNGDHIPDMIVTNKGSNDVSILFGSLDPSTGLWKGTPGPRLKSGGSGPIAVNVLSDPASPGGQDLAITNGASGAVSILPGRGQGFFNDTNPQILNIPGNPVLVSDQGGFLVTSTGAILDGNRPAFPTLFTSPASRPVLFAEPFFAGNATVPELFVARADGTVELLTSDTGSSYTETETLGSIPGEPSELAVVPEDGQPEDVLVTEEGSDHVFTLSLGIPTVALPAPSAVPVGELQPLPSSEVPVVPVLALQGQESALTVAVPSEQTGPDSLTEEVSSALSEPGQEEITATTPLTDDGETLVAVAPGGDDGGDARTDQDPADRDVTPFVSGDQDASQPETPPTSDDLHSPNDKVMPDRAEPDPLAPLLPADQVKPQDRPLPPPTATGTQGAASALVPGADHLQDRAETRALETLPTSEVVQHMALSLRLGQSGREPGAEVRSDQDSRVPFSEGSACSPDSAFDWRTCRWEDEGLDGLASDLLVAALLLSGMQAGAGLPAEREPDQKTQDEDSAG